MQQKKVSLVGAGNIGGTMAYLMGLKSMAEVAIIDINTGVAKGKGLDAAQAMAIFGSDCHIYGGGDMDAMEGSDVVIVTAGSPRKPNMSRDDLLNINAKVIESVADNIAKYCPKAFVIVITNPLDAMVQLMQSRSGLPSHKVVGMAGVLDGARFRCFLAQALKVSVEDIHTVVMGGHGDTMVPLITYTSVAGIPLSKLIDSKMITKEQVDDIIERTRKGGGEIVGLLGTGSAFYAPATAAAAMAESYMFNRRRVMACAAYLKGEYGYNNMYMGVPAIIGSRGVEKIIECPLEGHEKAMLEVSAKAVASLNKWLVDNGYMVK